ncbi:MAG: ATP synthase F1 subunit delta [Verrucomicrobiota bacterium]|nr:ATP synthase F1 subunit delta [Verrucomicrobiota bacterium]
MKNSREALKEGKKFLRACTSGDTLDEVKALNIVKALIEKKPPGFRDILNAFTRLLRLELQKRSVLVESAAALDKATFDQIKVILEKSYGKGLDFTQKTNPGLLAGIKIRAGSDIYDGSVAGRLEKLKESF